MVKVEYHNLGNDEERLASSGVLETSTKDVLRFPIVEIDGKIELVGYIDFETIADIVDAKLKVITR